MANFVPTPIQLCDIIASALTPVDAVQNALDLAVANPHVNAQIIRTRLAAHGVNPAAAESFIARYTAAKQGRADSVSE